MNDPVLILGGSMRMAVTIARSLWRRGIPVDWASFSSSGPRGRSRAIANAFVLPGFRHAPAEFGRSLMSLVECRGYDLLIPGNDVALAAVGEHYGALSSCLTLACPSPEVIDRVLDKSAILEAAKQCGIPVPRTHLVSRASELEALRHQMAFPAVVKPRSVKEEHQFQVKYVERFEQLGRLFGPDTDDRAQMLVQEYFRGYGLGVEVLLDQGRPVAMFQHRRLKELPSTGGVSVLAESEVLDATLARYAVTLLRHLGWEGVAMVEFRARGEEGAVVLMEVNGRFWGSIFLAVGAGIDFPFYVWQLAHGEQPRVPGSYRAGVRFRWTAGEVRRIWELVGRPPKTFPPSPSAWEEFTRLATELRRPARDALWLPRDPLPAIGELAQVARAVMSSAGKTWMRKVLPEWAKDVISIGRRLGVRRGLGYLQLRLSRALRVGRAYRRGVASDVRSVLFVCHGNIIRSPMAAALLRRELLASGREGIAVKSAGLFVRRARAADARASMVAQEFGVLLEGHQAQPVTEHLISNADVVFAMDQLNEAELFCRYPEAVGKVFLLGAVGGPPGSFRLDIPDPYEGDAGDIRVCFDRLQVCVRAVVSAVRRGTGQVGATRGHG